MAEGLHVQELPFLALHGGVADHAGGAAHECDGLVAGALQVLEHHHAHEVAYVEAVGCGVDAQVGRGHAFLEFFVGAGHVLVNHAAPGEFFYEVHIYVGFVFCYFGITRPG